MSAAAATTCMIAVSLVGAAFFQLNARVLKLENDTRILTDENAARHRELAEHIKRDHPPQTS